MSTSNTVHKLPPKSFIVRYKGLAGTVTYDPDSKKWNWIVKLMTPLIQNGTESTQEKATTEVKKILEAASKGKNITSV